MEKIVLIDGNFLLFRSFFATKYSGANMKTTDGTPTNAVFGFHRLIEKIIEMEDATNNMLLVTFDTGKPTFRHNMFKEYKGTRSEAPDDLIPQFKIVREYLDAMNIKMLEIEGYEADDLIGSFATNAASKGFNVEIYSSDGDLLQLLSKRITVHRLKTGLSEVEHMTPQKYEEMNGLKVEQVIDLKALMGDSSDNIPGVKGIGPKTATTLLQQYGCLDSIYDNIDELKGKVKENLVLYKEDAYLSRELATINVDVPTDYNLENFKYEGYDFETLKEFFVKYQFNSFLKNLNDKQGISKDLEVEEKIEIIIDDFVSFNAPATISLLLSDSNYHRADVLGLGVYVEDKYFFLSKMEIIGNDKIRSWLESDSIKYTYDAKRLLVAMNWLGISVKGIEFDLQLAGFALSTNLKGDFNKLCMHYQIDNVLSESDFISKKSIASVEELAKYAVFIAKTIACIKPRIEEDLKKENQYELYQKIELPLTFVLAEMEFAGVNVDVGVLNHIGEDLEGRLSVLIDAIYDLADESFTIDSPKQLGVILFEKLLLPPKKKTKTGYSTDADVLDSLKPLHPIIEKIIEYRQLKKLLSTYVEGMKKMIFPDGKVHTIFKQVEAQTGRLTSVEPNLQNIPIKMEEGRKIRKAFKPSSEDKIIVAADYSQIELRVLADMANASDLIEAFNEEQDIHSKTAADVFGVELDEVTSDMRRSAKAINFGIIYGMSSFGLSEQLGVSAKEAQLFIDNYFLTYPKVKEYLDSVVELGEKKGYVMTLFNRKRDVSDIKSSNFALRQFAKRLAMNSPIQGTAADIIKLAMIKVDELLAKSDVDAKLLIQVHDELVFEVCQKDAEKLIEIVREGMEEVVSLKVKLKVEHAKGNTWYDAK